MNLPRYAPSAPINNCFKAAWVRKAMPRVWVQVAKLAGPLIAALVVCHSMADLVQVSSTGAVHLFRMCGFRANVPTDSGAT
jgi:hypothetical protein